MYRTYNIPGRYLQGIQFFRLMSPGESHKEEELSKDEIFLNKIRDYVIRNISSEEFSLEALVLELGYSRSQVHKKLKKITGKSLSVFVREIRLEEALKLLRAKAGTASEIAYRTGFSSPAYFNQCFTDYYGITPGEISKQEIQKPELLKSGIKQDPFSKPIKWQLRTVIIIIAVLLLAVIILVCTKIFNRDRPGQLEAEGKITVAVMPFQNRTGDDTKDFWQEMVQDNLIISLSTTDVLNIRQPESISILLKNSDIDNSDSITSSVAKKISEKLEAGVYISGSINSSGETIRISAKLVDPETEEIFKSFMIEGVSDSIIYLTDSLSAQINNFLIISVLHMEVNPNPRNLPSTSSPEAYRKFILGRNAHIKMDYPTAREHFLDAIIIDSNFIDAKWMLIWSYANPGIYDQAKKWCLKVFPKGNQMTRQSEARANLAYALLFETPWEVINAVRQQLEIDDQIPGRYFSLGLSYTRLLEYEKAIPEYEKALDIYKKWDLKPLKSAYYGYLGEAFHNTGQYRKERKLYRKAEKDFPDDFNLLNNQAILALSEGKTKAANEYIKKFISGCKERSFSEARITTNLGNIYLKAELFYKAEEYYREALKLEPESPGRMNSLARFLIDNERNITEGMELIEKALELSPDHYAYLDTKGWGLYKQGKYQEAYDILQKSWDLRMENAVYSHQAFLHLEEAKKAVANQNNEH